eukprot:8933345-Alexandrium_andersonii.AAC.1
MSASLVGSEMCIRDSGEQRGIQRAAAPWEGEGNAPEALVPFCCYPSGPVSYTHLTLPTICSV